MVVLPRVVGMVTVSTLKRGVSASHSISSKNKGPWMSLVRGVRIGRVVLPKYVPEYIFGNVLKASGLYNSS